jgi:hypothetical protein
MVIVVEGHVPTLPALRKAVVNPQVTVDGART